MDESGCDPRPMAWQLRDRRCRASGGPRHGYPPRLHSSCDSRSWCAGRPRALRPVTRTAVGAAWLARIPAQPLTGLGGKQSLVGSLSDRRNDTGRPNRRVTAFKSGRPLPTAPPPEPPGPGPKPWRFFHPFLYEKKGGARRAGGPRQGCRAPAPKGTKERGRRNGFLKVIGPKGPR